MRFNVYPGVDGRVVDANSSDAIVNATVTVTPGGLAKGKPAKSTTTGADGRFSVAPDKSWSVYVVPMDFAPLTAQVTASAPGYSQGVCQIKSSPDGSGTGACGDIHLEKRL